MTTITATVIQDSFSLLTSTRITTLQLRYPRFIHAEFMTHRVFSRNASSSRAVPVKRLIEDIKQDTAMPLHWGKNQPGMQARKEHDEPVHYQALGWNKRIGPAEDAWIAARDNAITIAEGFDAAGYHKQIVNRLLEPFSHINVVCTATEWVNFFSLRMHRDAQPEIYALAVAMAEAMHGSLPTTSEFHTPYVTKEELLQHPWDVCSMLSAARCARVSYMTHDSRAPEFGADLALATKLRDSRHMSPFEHAARSMRGDHANLKGWISRRTLMEEANDPLELHT